MYGIINAVLPSIVSISESLSNIHHTFGYAAIVAYRVSPRHFFFLSSLELTHRFAILSDSEEYVNEASQIHTFSPLHSTPKRANRKKTEQHRVSAPTVHHSPIYPAHGFSSADSYMSQNSISSSSRSDHRSEHSTDFPFAKKDDQIRVCVINFGSLISHDKHLQLCQFIETFKPDVILGCETKLESSIQSSSIFPDEYTVSQPNRKDRAYGGGGVLMYGMMWKHHSS